VKFPIGELTEHSTDKRSLGLAIGFTMSAEVYSNRARLDDDRKMRADAFVVGKTSFADLPDEIMEQ
jgi:hypothetical protein